MKKKPGKDYTFPVVKEEKNKFKKLPNSTRNNLVEIDGRFKEVGMTLGNKIL